MAALDRFLRHVSPGRVLDLGCGQGLCVERLNEMGYEATGFDIAANAPIPGTPFVVGCAWLLPFAANAFDCVFCTDVLEHIPEGLVGTVLDEIGRVSRTAYLEWADFVDGTGPLTIGEQAHLTVKPNDWWFQQLQDADFTVESWGERGHMGGGYAVCRSAHTQPEG